MKKIFLLLIVGIMISCVTKKNTTTSSLFEFETESQVIKLNLFKEKISETRTFEELGLTSSLEQASYFEISSSRWHTLWTKPHLVDTKLSEYYNLRRGKDGKEKQGKTSLHEGIQTRSGSIG